MGATNQLSEEQIAFLWAILEGTSIRTPCPTWSHLNIGTNQANLEGITIDRRGQVIYIAVVSLVKKHLNGHLPDAIGALTMARTIRLSQCSLSGPIPEAICDIRSMNHLDLSGNQLTGRIPEELCLLKKLVDLNLSDNKLAGELPAELHALTELLYLRVNKNDLEGGISEHYSECVSMVLLDVSDNPRMRGQVPQCLVAAKKLKVVNNNAHFKSMNDISLHAAQYPMYAIHRDQLLALDRFPSHEQAIKDGLLLRIGRLVKAFDECQLRQVTPDGGMGDTSIPARRSEFAFISHHWQDVMHPDDSANSKLAHLKAIATKYKKLKFFWLDFVCTPQEVKRNPELHNCTVASLPFYIKMCAYFFSLLGLKGKKRPYMYHQRGFCLLEMLIALTPVHHPHPIEGHYNHLENKVLVSLKVGGNSVELEWEVQEPMPPLRGEFTRFTDKDLVANMAEIFTDLYHQSWKPTAFRYHRTTDYIASEHFNSFNALSYKEDIKKWKERQIKLHAQIKATELGPLAEGIDAKVQAYAIVAKKCMRTLADLIEKATSSGVDNDKKISAFEAEKRAQKKARDAEGAKRNDKRNKRKNAAALANSKDDEEDNAPVAVNAANVDFTKGGQVAFGRQDEEDGGGGGGGGKKLSLQAALEQEIIEEQANAQSVVTVADLEVEEDEADSAEFWYCRVCHRKNWNASSRCATCKRKGGLFLHSFNKCFVPSRPRRKFNRHSRAIIVAES
jgi:hypothetical protein